MKPLWKSVFVVIVVMIGVWVVGNLVGFHISLVGSLVLSVLITLAINLPAILRGKDLRR